MARYWPLHIEATLMTSGPTKVVLVAITVVQLVQVLPGGKFVHGNVGSESSQDLQASSHSLFHHGSSLSRCEVLLSFQNGV